MAPFCMGKKPEKLWEQFENHNLNNVHFNDFVKLIEWFGFVQKGGKGSHQTYCYSGIQEILDLQPIQGEAKPYQIRQFLKLVELYQLKGKQK